MNFDANFKGNEVEVRLRKLAEHFPQLEWDSLYTMMTFIHTTHEVYNEMSGKLSEHNLSVGKMKILMPLFAYRKALTPSELAVYSGVTRSTMTSVIDGLERDGYIKRASLNDRRMTAIHLTDKGVEHINTVVPMYASFVSNLMQDFTEEDHKIFVGLLHKLRNGLERFKDS
ncbi:MarR family winged helix-turn-helix transcriptional regulator [Paenibacillus jiagnxiensis]|uniref:MarR family winged helix-turn-helix transcriptional regulator n=1 Tax=Paenibacillus jiagnxiensis TaxID=3228926 RepID=UPI0033A9E113